MVSLPFIYLKTKKREGEANPPFISREKSLKQINAKLLPVHNCKGLLQNITKFWLIFQFLVVAAVPTLIQYIFWR